MVLFICISEYPNSKSLLPSFHLIFVRPNDLFSIFYCPIPLCFIANSNRAFMCTSVRYGLSTAMCFCIPSSLRHLCRVRGDGLSGIMLLISLRIEMLHYHLISSLFFWLSSFAVCCPFLFYRRPPFCWHLFSVSASLFSLLSPPFL